MGGEEVERTVLLWEPNSDQRDALISLLADYGIRAIIPSGRPGDCIRENIGTYVSAAVFNVSSDDVEDDIGEVRKLIPDTIFLGYSNEGSTEVRRLVLPPKSVLHYDLGSSRYTEPREIAQAIRSIIATRQTAAPDFIEFNCDILEILSRGALSRTGSSRSASAEATAKGLVEELRTIIAKLMASDVNGKPLAEKVTVEPLHGSVGKSSAFIFKMTPKIILDGKLRKSAVLKFGPKRDIQKEAANYNTFVEWYLTVEQAVRKIGYQEGNQYAGLLYTYPMDKDGDYTSFADFVRARPLDDALAVVRRIFDKSNQHWLAVDGNRFGGQHDDFGTQYFTNVLRCDREDLLRHHDVFKDQESRISVKCGYDIMDFGKDTLAFPVLGRKWPNPIECALKPRHQRIRLSVAHGDMHANNILVNDTGDYALIDFFYTGYAHVFVDFIELEISLRYDLLSSSRITEDKRFTSSSGSDSDVEGLKALQRLELALLKCRGVGDEECRDPEILRNENLKRVYFLVREIRRCARDNFPDEMPFYWLGLAYASLRGLKYPFPFDVKVHRYMVSAMSFSAYDEAKQGKGG